MAVTDGSLVEGGFGGGLVVEEGGLGVPTAVLEFPPLEWLVCEELSSAPESEVGPDSGGEVGSG